MGSDPSFSPDGTKIVFASLRHGLGDIYIVNVDGTNLRRLTFSEEYEGEPVFSPDGSKIAFVSERDGNGEIYIMKSDGAGQRRLTDSELYDYGPVFSPDGSKVAFMRSTCTYDAEIYLVDIDGSKQKRITHNDFAEGNISFTQDNNIIRYSHFNTKTNMIRYYKLMLNNNKSQMISQLVDGDFNGSFSPDEDKMVFVSSRMTDYNIDNYTRTEIFIADSDGANQKQLTNTLTYKEHPTFSPDGKKIMFLSKERDKKGKGQIRIMNVDGSDLRTIINNY